MKAIVLIILLILPFDNSLAEVITGCSYYSAYSDHAGYWFTDSDMYIVAHGNSYGYCNDCDCTSDLVPADNIPHQDFAYFAICGAMCDRGPGTFSSVAKESIGFCDMGAPACQACWEQALLFQATVFNAIDAGGFPVKDAFDLAIREFPECQQCIQYHSNAIIELPPVPEQVNIVPIIYPLLLK